MNERMNTQHKSFPQGAAFLGKALELENTHTHKKITNTIITPIPTLELRGQTISNRTLQSDKSLSLDERFAFSSTLDFWKQEQQSFY